MSRLDYTCAASDMMRYLVGCGLATATVAGPVEYPTPAELCDHKDEWAYCLPEEDMEGGIIHKAAAEFTHALGTMCANQWIAHRNLDRRCYVEFCLGDSCATVCWDGEACCWKTIEDWGSNMVLSACCEHLVTVLNNSMQRG